MSKISKIICVLIIIFLIANVTSLATSIDMNLTREENVQNTDEMNDINTNSADINNQTDSDGAQDTITSAQDNIGGTAAPSSVSSIAQENMSFSNILNILIITVGVILILLAIAILIRLKG